MNTGVFAIDENGRAWVYTFGIWFMTPFVSDTESQAKEVKS
jgi:hypothetical protein